MTSPTIVSRTDAWPIVVSTVHGTEHSLQMLDETMTVWFTAILHGPHVLIVDMTHGHAGSSAKQRAHLGEGVTTWLKDPAHEQALRNVVELILIFDNVVIRGIVTAVTWLVPSSIPYSVAQNLDHAVSQATATLARRGIELTPASLARARGVEPRPSLGRPSY